MLDVRFLVRQLATLDRNKRQMWTTTWSWEDATNGSPDALLTQGTNAFLSKWLDMNGR